MQGLNPRYLHIKIFSHSYSMTNWNYRVLKLWIAYSLWSYKDFRLLTVLWVLSESDVENKYCKYPECLHIPIKGREDTLPLPGFKLAIPSSCFWKKTTKKVSCAKVQDQKKIVHLQLHLHFQSVGLYFYQKIENFRQW